MSNNNINLNNNNQIHYYGVDLNEGEIGPVDPNNPNQNVMMIAQGANNGEVYVGFVGPGAVPYNDQAALEQ